MIMIISPRWKHVLSHLTRQTTSYFQDIAKKRNRRQIVCSPLLWQDFCCCMDPWMGNDSHRHHYFFIIHIVLHSFVFSICCCSFVLSATTMSTQALLLLWQVNKILVGKVAYMQCLVLSIPVAPKFRLPLGLWGHSKYTLHP